MSLVSALSPQADAQRPVNSFDAQIKQLQKRIDAGVKNGTITADQATQIKQAIDAVQQTIDDAGGVNNLLPADKSDIGKLLRDIAKAVAGQVDNTGKKLAGGSDSDGDNDGSVGFNTVA